MLINERHDVFSLLFDSKPVEAGDTLLLFRQSEVLLRTPADQNRLPLWGEVESVFPMLTPLHAFYTGNTPFFYRRKPGRCSGSARPCL